LSVRSGLIPGPRRAGGFSLLELMVVLVISGVILGLGGMTFSSYLHRSSARRAAQVFARDLTMARSSALRSRAPMSLRFDEINLSYRISSPGSGTELVTRRFGANADVDLSAIDLRFYGDSVLFSVRGVADLGGTEGGASLGEARFTSGPYTYKVFFNSLGASKVEEG
jgi:prepilin-type N-terminal cleavage/methylation domain-containing protein